tara:strand:+ start:1309 stop:2196 length:888 start_codon:yes stop_codon:yes gene_type:complete
VNNYSLIQSFLDYCQLKKQYARYTLENYERDLVRLNAYALSCKLDLLSFDKLACRDFIAVEYDFQQSNKTLCRRISAYRTCWDFFQIQNLVAKNPWRQIRLPKVTQVLPKIIPTKKMISFLDNISVSTPLGFRNRVVCECLYGLGLRVSELVSLELSQINFMTGECRVIGKRDKERIAIMGDITIGVLKRYVDDFRGASNKTDSKTLILSNKGLPITVRSIQRIVKKCSLEQGIDPPLTPHVLRHCYASDLYKGGADISIIKELLGHEHVSTTEIYTHVAMDELKETITLAHPHG